jgi:hypothetical protein
MLLFYLEKVSKRGPIRIFQSGQTKDYKIGICSFSAKHAALRSKSKDQLTWNQDNVLEKGGGSDLCPHKLLLQWAGNIKIELSMLV